MSNYPRRLIVSLSSDGSTKMSFYKKRIVKPDTPDQLAWRLKHNAALARAKLDRAQAYPVLTPENFQEAADYQEKRIQELMTSERVS